MWPYLHEQLSDITLLSTIVRLFLAVLCGGVIGLERGSKKHQAGFRTHILVCTGAALAMMTNQYIVQNLYSFSDPARLGAQVISGIGFLGVGVIVVSSRNRIKGLTTAAGLWASACLGLAAGIGFYSGAIAAGIVIFTVLAFMQKIEYAFYSKATTMDIYLEVSNLGSARAFLKHLISKGYKTGETHVEKSSVMTENALGIYVTIQLPTRRKHDLILEELRTLDMVLFMEEVF